jgi:hypothetical protein
MITYKLCPKDPVTGEEFLCVQRLPDTTFIPVDPANRDYQEYLKWLEEGNTPEPADE